jgi:hypothetical protein
MEIFGIVLTPTMIVAVVWLVRGVVNWLDSNRTN